MNQYRILISRDYTHSKVILLHADDEEEARELALAKLSDVGLELDCAVPDSDDAEILGEVKVT